MIASFRTAARTVGLAALATGLAGGVVLAQQTGTSVHVRGTIESLNGSTLVVRSREGAPVTVKLNEGWGVSGVKAATLEDIKPGTFVGVASVGSGADMKAIEVLVFPAGVKSGEGSYAWDLLPESSMTNATVATTIQSVKGPVLTLAYPGGEKTISVTPETPIVTFATAQKSDLVPGATVFVPGQEAADKTISTARIVVGNNGIAPPM